MAPDASTTNTSIESEAHDANRSLNAVRSIVRALRINTRAIEQQMGISLAQLFVLQQLAEKPADSLNELADRTATHQSSVSVVVRRLVDAGFVTRTAAAADRRRVQIALTNAGHAKLTNAPLTIQTRLLDGLRQLSSDQRRTLADLLEAWLEASGIDISAPPPMLLEEDGDGR